MVSVLILSWNHEKFIEQSIRSVIGQTYKDIEIIFLDNNSSDKTFEIARNILRNSGVKFKAFKRERNYGIAENQNFLFNNSSGEFLCLVSGDDWLDEKNIQVKLGYFENDQSLGMVDSREYIYYEEFDIYEYTKVESINRKDVLQKLLKINFITGLGCVVKRKAIEDVGLWDENLLVEDGDMWIRLAQKYNIIKIHEPLVYYRRHSAGISKNYEFMYEGKMQIYNKFKHINDDPKQTERNYWETYIAAKVMKETSLKLFFEVLRKFHFNKLYIKLLLKSLIPVSWKQGYYKKSLIKRYKHITPKQ